MAAGWAVALAVGSSWPVLALWWAAGRAGFVLASGFRRPVAYDWSADGTPAGEDEAMRTLAARLGLDPVFDVQSLDRLTAPDSGADALARLRGLVAVITRAGVVLPPGLTPGTPAGQLLHAAARAPGGTRWIAGEGWREAVRADFGPGDDGHLAGSGEGTHRGAGESDGPGVERAGPGVKGGGSGMEGGGSGSGVRQGGPRRMYDGGLLAPWVPGSGDPRARWLGMAQVAAGVPATAWGVWRRSGGWAAAGALLLAHGALGMRYGSAGPPTAVVFRPWD